MTLPVTPRIYVASLSDYNAGRLHGVWIDLEGKDSEDVWEEINAMLRSSKEMVAEEWAIHDYEGFAPLSLHEYESIDNVVAIVEALEDHGQPFLTWLDCDSTRTAEDVSDFQESYRGEWDSLRAYAESFADDTGLLESIPEDLQRYFDFDSYASDLAHDLTVIDSDNGVYIFSDY